MKTEQEIRMLLEELKRRSSLSANMNYERAGAIEAIEYILGDHKYESIGVR